MKEMIVAPMIGDFVLSGTVAFAGKIPVKPKPPIHQVR